MQVRAIRTFSSNLGFSGEPKQLVRTGLVITVSDHYGRQLIAGKLAVLHNPEARPLAPQRNTDLGGAPRTKDGEGEGDEGNESCDDEAEGSETERQETESSQDQGDSSQDSSSEDHPTAGRARRSSSQRPGRRSRRRI